jgi:uncharacterized protein YcaQ
MPLLQARMRANRRSRQLKWEQRVQEFLTENASFRRYVMRELEQRGPLLSRELEDRSIQGRRHHRWWGTRHVNTMLEILHERGHIAVVGRRRGHRLWDLAERWYPETEVVPLREAERLLAEQRFRSLGVRLVKGTWQAHPDATDGPVPDRATLLSPSTG